MNTFTGYFPNGIKLNLALLYSHIAWSLEWHFHISLILVNNILNKVTKSNAKLDLSKKIYRFLHCYQRRDVAWLVLDLTLRQGVNFILWSFHLQILFYGIKVNAKNLFSYYTRICNARNLYNFIYFIRFSIINYILMQIIALTTIAL